MVWIFLEAADKNSNNLKRHGFIYMIPDMVFNKTIFFGALKELLD